MNEPIAFNVNVALMFPRRSVQRTTPRRGKVVTIEEDGNVTEEEVGEDAAQGHASGWDDLLRSLGELAGNPAIQEQVFRLLKNAGDTTSASGIASRRELEAESKRQEFQLKLKTLEMEAKERDAQRRFELATQDATLKFEQAEREANRRYEASVNRTLATIGTIAAIVIAVLAVCGHANMIVPVISIFVATFPYIAGGSLFSRRLGRSRET